MKTILLTTLLLSTPALAEDFTISGISGTQFTLHSNTIQSRNDKRGSSVVAYWTITTTTSSLFRMRVTVYGCGNNNGTLIMQGTESAASKTLNWVSEGPAVYDNIADAQCLYNAVNKKTY